MQRFLMTRAVEIPCPTCTACPISLRTSKKFQFNVKRQGLHRSSYEEYPDYEIYIFLIFQRKHMLRVFIRSASVRHMYPSRNKKNVNLQAFISPWTSINITKTCLYNIDPLKAHFYIVKLGFTGVYIIFLISAQKHRLWVSLEPPRRGGSNEYNNICFEKK